MWHGLLDTKKMPAAIPPPGATNIPPDVKTLGQILIVSSESQHRAALSNILSREGWHPICASTATESGPILAEQSIALVFCERLLSDGGYWDVLEIAKSLNLDIPLIVTSRVPDWAQYLDVLRHSATDLIGFPCAFTDVVSAINRARRSLEDRAAKVVTPNQDSIPRSPLSCSNRDRN
jgi:DNA-binding NtrC family response regulator